MLVVFFWSDGYHGQEQVVQIGGLTMTFGDKLSKLRKENHYTQEQLDAAVPAYLSWAKDIIKLFL